MNFIEKQAALRAGPMDRTDRRYYKLNLKHEKRYEEEKQKEYTDDARMAASIDSSGQFI